MATAQEYLDAVMSFVTSELEPNAITLSHYRLNFFNTQHNSSDLRGTDDYDLNGIIRFEHDGVVDFYTVLKRFDQKKKDKYNAADKKNDYPPMLLNLINIEPCSLEARFNFYFLQEDFEYLRDFISAQQERVINLIDQLIDNPTLDIPFPFEIETVEKGSVSLSNAEGFNPSVNIRSISDQALLFIFQAGRKNKNIFKNLKKCSYCSKRILVDHRATKYCSQLCNDKVHGGKNKSLRNRKAEALAAKDDQGIE